MNWDPAHIEGVCSTWGPSQTRLVYPSAYVNASIRWHLMDSYKPWPCFNMNNISPCIRIPIIKIRRSQKRVVIPSIWEWAIFSLYDPVVVFHVYYSNYLEHVNELLCLWLPFTSYYSKYHDRPNSRYWRPQGRGPFYKYGFTLIPAWIKKLYHYKVYDEIIFLFANFNGATIEVWKWTINFIPHFIGHVIIYPCRD